MSGADDLDSLGALDRELLHVFVAGPGKGEGIAIALPGEGWILVDGCTTDTGEIPLESVVTRWRSRDDEPVVAMVLTHPHEDHVFGFAELVTALEPVLIAVAGCGPGKPNLRTAMDAQVTRARAGGSDRVREGSVLGALIAIERWEELHPGAVVPLGDGAVLNVSPSFATVVARAPDLTALQAFLADPNLRHANHFSIVLEVEYGTARVVLTGDLPRYLTGTTTPIPTGWDSVAANHPQLGSHAVLKVPHHGSAEAMHPALMPPAASGSRAWPVTPYNSSKLPRVADLEGMPRLLSWQPSILLTAVPASRSLQSKTPSPGVVQFAQLVSRVVKQPTGVAFLDSAGVDVTPGDAGEPLDPVWCVAVDRSSNVVGRWRGRSALEIVP